MSSPVLESLDFFLLSAIRKALLKLNFPFWSFSIMSEGILQAIKWGESAEKAVTRTVKRHSKEHCIQMLGLVISSNGTGSRVNTSPELFFRMEMDKGL